MLFFYILIKEEKKILPALHKTQLNTIYTLTNTKSDI